MFVAFYARNVVPNSGTSYNAPLGVHLCNRLSSNIFMPCCNVLYTEILDAALACYKLLVNRVDVILMSICLSI